MKFENFYKDMGDRPTGLTLERNDPNGNYELGNCTWATRKIQSRNKRSTKLTLADAIEIIKLRNSGMTYKAIGKVFKIDLTHAWRVYKGTLWPEARPIVDEKYG